MLITVIDTETTGIDVTKDDVVEIAGVILDSALGEIVAGYHTLVHATNNPEEAFKVNRIPQEALNLEYCRAPDLEPIVRMMRASDAIIAHNAGFDQPLTDRLLAAFDESPVTTPWVCSMNDIMFPQEYEGSHFSRTAGNCRKLSHMASDYGISALGAHRAMADVMILSQLLLLVTKEGKYSLENQIKRSFKPKRLYNAVIPKPWEDDGKGNKMAKRYGFRYNPAKKLWQKALLDEEVNEFPFDVFPD